LEYNYYFSITAYVYVSPIFDVLVSGGITYAITLTSGIVYLKILTKLINSRQIKSADIETLKETADEVIEDEDIEAIIKEAKNEYRKVKA
jgi:hypothetical protein